MHYGNTAFTTNGKETIASKFDPNRPLGGKTVSWLDRSELFKMYQCHKGLLSLSTEPFLKCLKYNIIIKNLFCAGPCKFIFIFEYSTLD